MKTLSLAARLALTGSLLAAVAGALSLERGPAAAQAVAPKPVKWKKTVLDRVFRAEGACMADVNVDGQMDILAGEFVYMAPDWEPRQIAPTKEYAPATGYSECFLTFAMDVDDDLLPDQIVVGFPGKPAVWRKNPGRRATGHWEEFPITESACNESPIFADLDGDDKPELVTAFKESQMAYYQPGPDPKKGWKQYLVGEPGKPGVQRFAHGLGVGDVDGDRFADILTPGGYYRAPIDPKKTPWKFIPAKLGPNCAQMYTHDFDGDDDMDVISSSAHQIGVWWYEQVKGADGKPDWKQHVIDDTFSQSHALMMFDINEDGKQDFVTGKRWWAHGPNGDVNPGDPAVLYWYEFKRTGSSVEWARHEIDNDSGVGTQFTVMPMRQFRPASIAIANKKGVFLFEQLRAE